MAFTYYFFYLVANITQQILNSFGMTRKSSYINFRILSYECISYRFFS